jgi:hypothetical protein
MKSRGCTSARYVLALAILVSLIGFSIAIAAQKLPSDSKISREIMKKNNREIIEEFLKYELQDVNRHVTDKLLPAHPSLEFFIKQAERQPLESLIFLEDQVHRLRDAQKNIGSLPYSIAFSSSEKKKILSLKPIANRIVSYGIPLMKRDFYILLQAMKELADKRRKHPMELIPNPAFRDAVYRHCTSDPRKLDKEMGEVSYGEKICIALGWVLEQVTVTRLWLVFNDNKLPRPKDYELFRKKRSEYWAKRLKTIYQNQK